MRDTLLATETRNLLGLGTNNRNHVRGDSWRDDTTQKDHVDPYRTPFLVDLRPFETALSEPRHSLSFNDLNGSDSAVTANVKEHSVLIGNQVWAIEPAQCSFLLQHFTTLNQESIPSEIFLYKSFYSGLLMPFVI